MKTIIAALVITFLLVLADTPTLAQSVTKQATDKTEKKEAKTQLEAFEADTGAVIIRSWSKIGSVSGEYGSVLTVEIRELINAASGSKAHGIRIVIKGDSARDREANSYVDYDEIDSLIKGIEYIAKIDRSVSKLENFQADYKTRGDLTISTYTSGSSMNTTASVGRIYSENVFLSQASLGQLKELIVSAKAKLDEVKK